MAFDRMTDLMKQGFMKSRKKVQKKAVRRLAIYVLHYNWANDWTLSRRHMKSAKFAFHALNRFEATTLANKWARRHGFSTDDVGIEDVGDRVTGFHHYNIELHDEYMT